MIIIFNVIFCLMVWSICGAIILGLLGVVDEFDDLSYVNPIKIYRIYRVNYLGATLICIIYNLLCPIGSIGYWFYKLCTFGRK